MKRSQIPCIFILFLSFNLDIAAEQVRAYSQLENGDDLSIAAQEMASTDQVDSKLREIFSSSLAKDKRFSQYSDEYSIFVGSSKAQEGATWLQLNLGDIRLGDKSFIAIQSHEDGELQILDKEQLSSNSVTGAFNGDTVLIYTGVHPEDSVFEQDLSDEGVSIEGAFWGVAIPESVLEDGAGLGRESARLVPESICGIDDRSPSSHPFVGRLMPVGCTAWLTNRGTIVTAGHCVGPDMLDLEFNVPASSASGVPVRARIADQYRVDPNSIIYDENVRIGADWAVFRVLDNTTSGKSAFEVQGDGFQITNQAPTREITVIGHGLDNSPRTRNQVQQIHTGDFVGEYVRSDGTVVIKHKADTRGGNSGSPVISIMPGGEEIAYGVHTNAGCSASTGSNNSTGFKNQRFFNAAWSMSQNTNLCQAQKPEPSDLGPTNPGCIVTCENGIWKICGCTGSPICT